MASGCTCEAFGSKFTCANPLSTLAVIDPDSPLVTSLISVTRPSAESWIEMSSWSPASMNRSVVGLGSNDSPVKSSGAGGESGSPLSVMNAKFAGSMPTVFRQSALLLMPWFWSRLRLKIAMAAHHLVASQLMASSNGTHPGG
jgi:hypothetical protein